MQSKQSKSPPEESDEGRFSRELIHLKALKLVLNCRPHTFVHSFANLKSVKSTNILALIVSEFICALEVCVSVT